MKILFIIPYPLLKSPSQRFRFEQYFVYLDKLNYTYQVHSFIEENTWNILYSKGNIAKKIAAFMKGAIKRFLLLKYASQTEYVFIHREALPFGFPVIEFVIAKILKKKIIYDFDDAIWMPQAGYGNIGINFLKNPSKTNSIIKWSYKVSCGNAYLCNYAGHYNKNIVLNPTTIDTVNLHNRVKDQFSSKIVIGWTGTHSTLMYLAPIVPVMARLEQEFDFDFLVICNTNPAYPLSSFKFVPWNNQTEINDLLSLNIGLMPLIEDKWTSGKCGFKALQYMALGIPAVVSPVGVNKKIVENGSDGFLCQTEEEWYIAIKTLILNPSLRAEMGAKAREKIVNYYSVESNKENFINLFA